jgi:hypothetical protein
MTRTKKILLFISISLLFALIIPVKTMADPPPDPCGDPFDPACPIDGGVSLLIAAGIGIGAMKHKSKK